MHIVHFAIALFLSLLTVLTRFRLGQTNFVVCITLPRFFSFNFSASYCVNIHYIFIKMLLDAQAAAPHRKCTRTRLTTRLIGLRYRCLALVRTCCKCGSIKWCWLKWNVKYSWCGQCVFPRSFFSSPSMRPAPRYAQQTNGPRSKCKRCDGRSTAAAATIVYGI